MIDERIRQVRERELVWDKGRSERMRAGIERKAAARANRRRIAAMARSGLVFAAFLALAVRGFAFAGVSAERSGSSSAEVDAIEARASSVPAPRLAFDDGGSRGDVALRD
jgi:hypothetical protein